MRVALIAVFLLLPVVELAIIIEVGRALGTWAAVLLVIGTGALGAIMAQSQGFKVIRRIQLELQAGRMPATSLLHGFMIFAGGMLLVLPGLLTDLVGFALLIPPVRHAILRWLESRLRHWLQEGRVVVRIWH